MCCADLSLKRRLPRSNLLPLKSCRDRDENQGQQLSFNHIQSSIMYNLSSLMGYIYIYASPNVPKISCQIGTLTKLPDGNALNILQQPAHFFFFKHTAYKMSPTRRHTAFHHFKKNQTHPPESLGRLHPGGFPVKAQRCPHRVIEYHFEAACGSCALAAETRLSLKPLAVPVTPPPQELLPRRAAVRFDGTPAFSPFKRQPPHPEPLNYFPATARKHKQGRTSPSVSKPGCAAH